MIRDHSTYNTRVFTPFIVPPNRIEFFENEKESPTVCHSCIINRQRYVKFFVSTDRYYYYSLAETTNAANYTTTRAANRTSTTRLLLTIIYYFFPLPFWNVSRTIVLLSLSILLYPGKKRVCNVSTSVSKPTCQFVVINVFIFAIDRERKWESFGKSKGEIGLLRSIQCIVNKNNGGMGWCVCTFSDDNNRDRKLKILSSKIELGDDSKYISIIVGTKYFFK